MPLDKHYGDFGGLDVTTNPLNQTADSCREGSKNFGFDYQSKLRKREGLQHKSDVIVSGIGGTNQESRIAGLVEYIYTDVDSQEKKTKLLCVGTDGYLYRIKKDFISFYNDGSGSLSSYSLYYDELTLTHKVEFKDSSDVVLGSVNISTSMTLTALETAIDALSITGLSTTVFDEDGTAYASTKLAYLLDVVYDKSIARLQTISNGVMFFDKVKCADSDLTGSNDYGLIPFLNTKDNQANDDYSGVSFENHNNCVYITDGSFVYKYDQSGVLYMAGMPDLNRFQYWSISYSSIAGALSTSKKYKYSFQLCNVDYTGAFYGGNSRISGELTGDNAYEFTISGLQTTTDFSTSYNPNKQFPIYSCCVNGDQAISNPNDTFTVELGHNIKVGMCLRFHSRNSGVFGYIYLKVTAATDTTITVSGSIYDVVGQSNVFDYTTATSTLKDGLVINGCYVPTDFQNTFIQNSIVYDDYHPVPIYGPFLRIGRTLGDGETFYQLYDAPIPHNKLWNYTFTDTLKDDLTTVIPPSGEKYSYADGLSRITADAETTGKDIPRLCKYITSWQGQLAQAGFERSHYMFNVETKPYPNFSPSTVSTKINGIDFGKFNLSDTCDPSSVYWETVAFQDAFSRSGNFEEDFNYIYNDDVNGIFANKEALFVFKDRTTAYLSGTPANGDIVKEFLEADIGCASNLVIKDVSGQIVFMDESLGFWSVVAGRLPVFIGNPLLDYFKRNNTQIDSKKLRVISARATNFKEQDQYVCYVHAGPRAPYQGLMSDFSLYFVLDYSDKRKLFWSVWTGPNALGGVLAHNGQLLIASGGNLDASTPNNRIWAQKFSDSKYDFSDHTSAIEFSYKGAFLTYGEPSIDKSWIRCVLNSIAGGFNLIVKQYANFIDTSVSDYTVAFPAEGSGKNTVKMDVKASIPKLSGLSWEFYNNEVNSDVSIDGWEVEYQAPFDRSEPKK